MKSEEKERHMYIDATYTPFCNEFCHITLAIASKITVSKLLYNYMLKV